MILPSDTPGGLAAVPLASLIVGIAAALAYAAAAFLQSPADSPGSRRLLLVAWLLHAVTVVLGLADGAPRFGFAPALSVTAWLALTIYGVESRMFPELRPQRLPAILGSLCVLLAVVFPGALLHVNASPWLPIHLALGVASYGLFAAAVVHAALMRRAEKQMRLAGGTGSGVPLLTLERLTFQFVKAGFVLLSATLLFGWLFGESIYGPGRAWHWDHKTIFSLLAWISFAVLLVGRARFGWRGRKAARVLYMGAALLLLGYVGSRFVLEVILRRPL